MTNEKKEILLKDLCTRLPYGVKGIITFNGNKDIFTLIGNYNTNLYLSDNEACHVEDFAPYLRPMSSMTEEELSEYRALCRYHNITGTIIYEDTYKSFDWLNAHHFDYRGLIPMGLALLAPGNMYNEI